MVAAVFDIGKVFSVAWDDEATTSAERRQFRRPARRTTIRPRRNP